MKRNQGRVVQLNNSYYLKLQQGYDEDCMGDLKEELQACFGAKLVKLQKDNELRYTCQNSNCHFHLYFNIQTTHFGHHVIFRLVSFNEAHLKACVDPDVSLFLKRKRELTILGGAMRKIVHEKLYRGEQIGNPNDFMRLLCEELELHSDFLYEGLSRADYRRKIKKRFDNLISEAKNNLTHDLKLWLQDRPKYMEKVEESLMLNSANQYHQGHPLTSTPKKSYGNETNERDSPADTNISRNSTAAKSHSESQQQQVGYLNPFHRPKNFTFF